MESKWTMTKKVMAVVGSNSYGTPMQHKYSYLNESMMLDGPRGLKEKPDLVVLTGGEDINPQMYGEKSIYPHAFYNNERDALEKEWFLYAKANKIPMVGVCRGMQMFTIMSGGRLLQHIEGHSRGGSHPVITNEQKEVKVNSLHHQVCIPLSKSGHNVGAELLAWSQTASDWKAGSEETEELFVSFGCIPEAIWFPKIKALGVQFHPEMMQKDSEGYKYFQDIFTKYIG